MVGTIASLAKANDVELRYRLFQVWLVESAAARQRKEALSNTTN